MLRYDLVEYSSLRWFGPFPISSIEAACTVIYDDDLLYLIHTGRAAGLSTAPVGVGGGLIGAAVGAMVAIDAKK